jgi:hypothetical protein
MIGEGPVTTPDYDLDEEEVHKHLTTREICPYGYSWIAEADGWRCEAGSHFITNKQIKEWLENEKQEQDEIADLTDKAKKDLTGTEQSAVS